VKILDVVLNRFGAWRRRFLHRKFDAIAEKLVEFIGVSASGICDVNQLQWLQRCAGSETTHFYDNIEVVTMLSRKVVRHWRRRFKPNPKL
jgi:hypothetical protein